MHAVSSYLCRGIEAVITGLTRNQFVDNTTRGFESLPLRQKILQKRIRFLQYFLSKSQTWYIITARSVVDIISPLGCISSRFSVHSRATRWYTTRCVGDIQNSVLMIYTPRAWLVIKVRISLSKLHQKSTSFDRSLSIFTSSLLTLHFSLFSYETCRLGNR